MNIRYLQFVGLHSLDPRVSFSLSQGKLREDISCNHETGSLPSDYLYWVIIINGSRSRIPAPFNLSSRMKMRRLRLGNTAWD